jgi:hypothetical protein
MQPKLQLTDALFGTEITQLLEQIGAVSELPAEERTRKGAELLAGIDEKITAAEEVLRQSHEPSFSFKEWQLLWSGQSTLRMKIGRLRELRAELQKRLDDPDGVQPDEAVMQFTFTPEKFQLDRLQAMNDVLQMKVRQLEGKLMPRADETKAAAHADKRAAPHIEKPSETHQAQPATAPPSDPWSGPEYFPDNLRLLRLRAFRGQLDRDGQALERFKEWQT